MGTLLLLASLARPQWHALGPPQIDPAIPVASWSLGQLANGQKVRTDQSACNAVPKQNLIICLEKDVHLWVERRDDPLKFHVAGFVNPGLELRSGGTLTVTIVNLSSLRLASFSISSRLRPPFGPMQGPERPRPWTYPIRRIGPALYPALPPARDGIIYTVTQVFRLMQPVAAYYFDIYPGHARAGAFGKIKVVP
ncbi:MAG: hypothetical protein ACRD01_14490 [Terriglobales bacterium]